MKIIPAFVMGVPALAATPAALAQYGHMMNGDMWGAGWMGGYGGGLMIVLLAVVVGLVVWLVKRGDK